MTAGLGLCLCLLLTCVLTGTDGQNDAGCSRLRIAGGGQCLPVGSCSLYVSGLCTGGWVCCQRPASRPQPTAAAPRPDGGPGLLTNRVASVPSAILFPGQAVGPAFSPPLPAQPSPLVPLSLSFAPLPVSTVADRPPSQRRRTLLDPPFECRREAATGRRRRSLRPLRPRRQASPFLVCGATLISERYMLTAAHCITKQRPINVVRLGGFAMTEDGKPTVPTNYTVEKITRHPGYKHSVVYHDLALIRLARPVTFTDTVRPYCLAAPGQDLPGTEARVAGIGATEFNGDINDRLLEAAVPIVSAEECFANLTGGRFSLSLPEGITAGVLCAGGGESGRDACQGDSGGPLRVDTDDGPRLVGVVAAGEGCSAPGKPGLYTRVTHYIDWIDSVVYGDE